MKQGWEYKKIKDVTSLFADGDWIESKDQSELGLRLIQTGNIGNGFYIAKDDKPHYISEDTFERLKCTEIFEGDCLISRLPQPLGRACILPKLDFRAITAVDCSIIRFKDFCIPRYFVYYTQSSKYQNTVDKNATGTTRKRISRKNLENISIPVPPLTTQQSIVSELDTLSQIIADYKEQLADYDKLEQSIFYDMFGDPVKNEKGWELRPLGETCEVSSFKRVLIEDVVETGIPFVRGTELTEMCNLCKGEYINFTLFITQEHYDRVKAITGVPKIGDLLIPSINSKGYVWYVDTDAPMYYKDGRVLWIHVNESYYNGLVLRKLISEILRITYSVMASGATFAELKLFLLRELNVPLPPLPLQQQFASKIESIEQMKADTKAALQDAELLFQSRMDYWFNA